ncbi:hypothetical protein [Paraburkholderia solisilvae]|uniref:Uncharacterized protein n=1 Tax=Paraburkholderia solisilvae TaxID=624376 RepID=A0A6J5CXZ6_9BURK|nr:hypothetical protein [Paraburkholderia solisilvae]CAB3746011.1 hypothetical protein LMG29739_00079 [Paraburkholderia solisilvae]
MKRTLRALTFVTLTYLVGGVAANVYLEWPAPMPNWLFYSTMFVLRVVGIGPENNTDDAEVMATLIVACLSWTLTGIALWLLGRAVRRWRTRTTT